MVGIEDFAQSIEDAVTNARVNGISNARFYSMSAEKGLRNLTESGERFDVVLLDPHGREPWRQSDSSRERRRRKFCMFPVTRLLSRGMSLNSGKQGYRVGGDSGGRHVPSDISYRKRYPSFEILNRFGKDIWCLKPSIAVHRRREKKNVSRKPVFNKTLFAHMRVIRRSNRFMAVNLFDVQVYQFIPEDDQF